jgi:hypothetical protein
MAPKEKRSAWVLKRIAEAAHGLMGLGGFWIKVNKENTRKIRVSREEPEHEPGWETVQVETAPHPTLKDQQIRWPRSGPVEKVTITYRSGEEDVFYTDPPDANPMNPKWVDALFFSPSAVDKFVVPYLSAVYDGEAARQVHDTFVAGYESGTVYGAGEVGRAEKRSGCGVMIHRPPTIIITEEAERHVGMHDLLPMR